MKTSYTPARRARTVQLASPFSPPSSVITIGPSLAGKTQRPEPACGRASIGFGRQPSSLRQGGIAGSP